MNPRSVSTSIARPLLWASGLALAFTACAKNAPNVTGHEIGDEDFTSQSTMGGGGLQRTTAGGAPGEAAPAADMTASGTMSRTVEEADIYKVSGNSLFVLNAYRGLQIIDVANLDLPVLLAKVPLIGRPVDLYVRDGTAYVAVSDYFSYRYIDALAAPVHGSRVWAVDVRNPASPRVLGSASIEGDVDQTRIVGNILYVVSRRYGGWDYNGGPVAVAGDSAGSAGSAPGVTTGQRQPDLVFAQSFDISNPAAMRAVQRLDFPLQGWDTHANVTANRITLSQSGWEQNGPVTKFQVIDISDPNGRMALGATFQTTGQVRDRWGMDFDDSNGLFRVITQVSWGNNGASLEVWSARQPNAAQRVGRLELRIPEALTAARFDQNRAYLVTAHCTDPLWIADTSNPSQPVLQGSVEIPGRLDFVEPRGDRLIALGHDDSTCGGGRGAMNVSLFNVADASHPMMLTRVSFGEGYTYVGAKADDFRKVFQVLDDLGLILVPFQSWSYQSWTFQGGTQLIDYARDHLTKRGFAEHAGAITRAFPVRNRLVALSDHSLQVLDASDRDHPNQVNELDLARPVNTLAIIQGKAIELAGDWYRGDTELVVTDKTDPDAASPLARVRVSAPYARMFQDGEVIWLLARDYGHPASGGMPAVQPSAWLQGVDFHDPANPRLVGRLDVSPDDVGYGYGYWAWGYGDEAVLVGHAIAIHRQYYGGYRCPGCSAPQRSDQVKVIDVSNATSPRVSATVALDGSDWSWGLKAIGTIAWITHYEWVPPPAGTQVPSRVRYYVDRIDLANPSAPNVLRKVNVPGVFFHASTNGQTIYTEEVSYSMDWRSATTTLHQLNLTPQGTARLVANASFGGSPGGFAVNGGYAYVQTWDWSRAQNRTTIATVDLNGMHLAGNVQVVSQSAWLMKAAGGKLFLSSSWNDQGILVYDLQMPANPRFAGFVRTQGWVSDIIVSDNVAYLPSGYYGVPRIDLTPGAMIASIE